MDWSNLGPQPFGVAADAGGLGQSVAPPPCPSARPRRIARGAPRPSAPRRSVCRRLRRADAAWSRTRPDRARALHQRLRPSPHPPDSAGPACTSGVLVGAHHRGVHEVQVPVEVAPGIRLRLQAPQHPVEHAGRPPAVEPARHSPDSTIAGRQIRPRRTRAHDPEHAVQDLAVILGRPARARLLRRQQRGDLLSLRIGQFVASHPAHMGAVTPSVNPLKTRPRAFSVCADSRAWGSRRGWGLIH